MSLLGIGWGDADGLGTAHDGQVRTLEDRLELLLAESDDTELTVQDVSVAPRSKLRVACE